MLHRKPCLQPCTKANRGGRALSPFFFCFRFRIKNTPFRKLFAGVGNMSKREKSGKRAFLKGALWIAVGGFVAKLIGALYRIPLTNLIGGKGLGLYQMVYPVYCLLLTVSATGIPSSIAKLTAEKIEKGEDDRRIFALSMRLFLVIGGCGAVLMVLLAPFWLARRGARKCFAATTPLRRRCCSCPQFPFFGGGFRAGIRCTQPPFRR